MNANYHLRSVLACVLAVGSFSAFVHADEDLYQSKVKPLLRGRCYACHGALKQEGGGKARALKQYRGIAPPLPPFFSQENLHP